MNGHYISSSLKKHTQHVYIGDNRSHVCCLLCHTWTHKVISSDNTMDTMLSSSGGSPGPVQSRELRDQVHSSLSGCIKADHCVVSTAAEILKSWVTQQTNPWLMVQNWNWWLCFIFHYLKFKHGSDFQPIEISIRHIACSNDALLHHPWGRSVHRQNF